jgi:hypothetical protein
MITNAGYLLKSRPFRSARELSMTTSQMGMVHASPAEFRHKSGVIAESGALGPMPQQDAMDCHGHEMYPQKLVQLVGCHAAGNHNGARQMQ